MTPAEREAAIRAAVDHLVSVLLAAVTPEPADDRERLYSIPEAADVLAVGRSLLCEMIAAGRIDSIKVGRRRLLSASAITAFIHKAGATGSGS
jgi:excisionase family DNA binding protein